MLFITIEERHMSQNQKNLFNQIKFYIITTVAKSLFALQSSSKKAEKKIFPDLISEDSCSTT